MNMPFTFNTGDLVLVRSTKNTPWCIATFSHINNKNKFFKYIVNNGFCYEWCIPYCEFTKYLTGTCKNLYIPKKGDKIIVSCDSHEWYTEEFEKFTDTNKVAVLGLSGSFSNYKKFTE